MSPVVSRGRAIRRLGPVLLAAVLGSAACGDKGAAPGDAAAGTGAVPATGLSAAVPPATAVAVSPPGTSDGWELGPAALTQALSARVPVLLYMSSEWCPPCRALEANLLSRQAFKDATANVRRVRIDGDADGAQAVAERFDAQAYPTLLLLSAEGRELFRAHHAVSLEELVPAVIAATAAGGRFEDALARLGTRATAADCALFTALDWGPASGMTLPIPDRLAALKRAFAQCGGPLSPGPADGGDTPPGKTSPDVTRAALAAHLLGLAATADSSADSALPAAEILPMAGVLLDAILKHEETAWAARTLVTTWATPVVSWAVGADRGPGFAALRDRWLRAAAAIRARPGAPLDMQLLGYNPVLDFHRMEQADAPLPASVRGEIEEAVARVSGLAQTPAERHAVVPNAAYLLRSIGQRERARAMLLGEIAKSAAPSYYLTTLSQWAFSDGELLLARRFALDAVATARGRTSRLQWMVNELSMYSNPGSDDGDRVYLLQRATETYTLLFAQDDAFLGRNRARAARLAEILAPLHAEPAVKALVAAHSPRCDSLPAESRPACRAHFAALRSGDL